MQFVVVAVVAEGQEVLHCWACIVAVDRNMRRLLVVVAAVEGVVACQTWGLGPVGGVVPFLHFQQGVVVVGVECSVVAAAAVVVVKKGNQCISFLRVLIVLLLRCYSPDARWEQALVMHVEEVVLLQPADRHRPDRMMMVVVAPCPRQGASSLDLRGAVAARMRAVEHCMFD